MSMLLTCTTVAIKLKKKFKVISYLVLVNILGGGARPKKKKRDLEMFLARP